jgi:hypothetical protein
MTKSGRAAFAAQPLAHRLGRTLTIFPARFQSWVIHRDDIGRILFTDLAPWRAEGGRVNRNGQNVLDRQSLVGNRVEERNAKKV